MNEGHGADGPPGVRYRVEHETRYVYASSASTSQHVAYLRPRDVPRQRLAWHALDVEPRPAAASRRVDYFGNPVDQFTVLSPHTELLVRAGSLLEVSPPAAPLVPDSSPPWEEVRAPLAYRKGAPVSVAAPFAYASPYVAPNPELAEYASASFTPGRPLLAAAIDLMHRIHAEFLYDTTATTITTPVSRVLAERRGVCQDFAHLQISCLRVLGLAARYVSGYILTDPPPGHPRLAGADASHAWPSVHCPRNGRVDLDPTNDLVPDHRHVTLAWGRDYGDVEPAARRDPGRRAAHAARGVRVMPVDGEEWGRALAGSGGG